MLLCYTTRSVFTWNTFCRYEGYRSSGFALHSLLMLCDYIIRIQDIRIAKLPEEWSLQIRCDKRVCILPVTKSNYKSYRDLFALISRHARPTRLGGLCPRQRHPLGRVWNPHLLQTSSYETEEGTSPIHLVATIPFSDIRRYRTLFGTTVPR